MQRPILAPPWRGWQLFNRGRGGQIPILVLGNQGRMGASIPGEAGSREAPILRMSFCFLFISCWIHNLLAVEKNTDFKRLPYTWKDYETTWKETGIPHAARINIHNLLLWWETKTKNEDELKKVLDAYNLKQIINRESAVFGAPWSSEGKAQRG